MGELVEFPTGDGGTVLVEVNQGLGGPVTRGMGGSAVIERAQQSIEAAVARVQPALQGVFAQLRSLPERPDDIHVEFGLNLHAEAGAFVAAASTTANFTVALTWRSSPESSAT